MSGSLSEGGTPLHNKLNMDARAAELKERLLKNRSQKPSRDNSLPPTNDPPQSIPTSTEKSSQVSRPSSRPLFRPHPVPQQPPEISVPADANDIAALISSISSASQDEPDEEPKAAAAATKPATRESPLNSASSQQNLSSVLKMEPMPPTNQALAKIAQNPDRCGPAPSLEDGEIGGDAPKTSSTSYASNPPHQNQRSTSASVASASSEVGSISIAPIKPKEIEIAAPPPQAVQDSLQHRSPKDVDNKSVSPDVARENGSRPNRDGGRAIPQDATPSNAPSHKPSNGGLRGPDSHKIPRPSEPPRKDNRPGDGATTALQQAAANPKLSQLLKHDSDLRDWLYLTQYFDAEARMRKLTRFRKLAEMEAEQKRIEAEQQRITSERQKLLAEEELDRGGPWRSTPASVPPQSAIFSSQVNNSSTPSVRPGGNPSPPLLSPETPGLVTEASSSLLAKRPADKAPPDLLLRSAKVARVDERSSAVDDGDGEDGDNGGQTNTDGRLASSHRGPPKLDESRPPAPHGSPPSRRPLEYGSSPERYGNKYRMRSPPPYPRDSSPRRFPRAPGPRDTGHRVRSDQFDRGGYGYHPPRYHNYPRDSSRDGHRRSFSPRGRRPYSPVRFPKHVDLGRTGDTRYFIVKSFSDQNVRRCMEDGIWTTQTQNGEILTSAFSACKNIILFFSVNKSRAFQGYARMTSTPTPSIPRPKWMSGIHWETTPPFEVEWLSTTEVEFFRIGHLKNSFNEDQAVLVGKDGQEIESECGRQLLLEMEEVARAKNDFQSGPPGHGYKREFRGRGGYHFRGGRGGKKYFKQEEH